jgi:hypothetical protein
MSERGCLKRLNFSGIVALVKAVFDVTLRRIRAIGPGLRRARPTGGGGLGGKVGKACARRFQQPFRAVQGGKSRPFCRFPAAVGRFLRPFSARRSALGPSAHRAPRPQDAHPLGGAAAVPAQTADSRRTAAGSVGSRGAAVAAARGRRRMRGSRPISRVLSWTAIHLGRTSPLRLLRPTREPPRAAGCGASAACSSIWSCSGWGLPCRRVLPPARCALTAPFHPCRPPQAGAASGVGGLFSVALSVGSRPPGVTWHPALWSPDFPPRRRIRTRPRSGCLADSLTVSVAPSPANPETNHRNRSLPKSKSKSKSGSKSGSGSVSGSVSEVGLGLNAAAAVPSHKTIPPQCRQRAPAKPQPIAAPPQASRAASARR